MRKRTILFQQVLSIFNFIPFKVFKNNKLEFIASRHGSVTQILKEFNPSAGRTRLRTANSLKLKFNPRNKIIKFFAWVKGAGRCFLNYCALPLLILSGVWSAYERARAYDDEIHGQMGGVWYRYFSSGGNFGSAVEQEAIGGAIKGVIDLVEPNWFSDIYCITMSRGGTWHGTLLIGPDPSAMTATCSGAHKGNYEMDLEKLTAPWSRNNQDSTY